MDLEYSNYLLSNALSSPKPKSQLCLDAVGSVGGHDVLWSEQGGSVQLLRNVLVHIISVGPCLHDRDWFTRNRFRCLFTQPALLPARLQLATSACCVWLWPLPVQRPKFQRSASTVSMPYPEYALMVQTSAHGCPWCLKRLLWWNLGFLHWLLRVSNTLNPKRKTPRFFASLYYWLNHIESFFFSMLIFMLNAQLLRDGIEMQHAIPAEI